MMENKALRIVIYGVNYAPEPTATGKYTGDIGNYLASRSWQIEVVAAAPHYPGWAVLPGFRNEYKTERNGSTRITRCPLFLTRKMRGIWRLLAPLSFAVTSAPVMLWRVLRFRPSVILTVAPSLSYVPTALLAARLVGAKSVLHVQDLEVDAAFALKHLKGDMLKRMAFTVERWILGSVDRIVTISDKMAERLASKGVPPTKISVVRNWVDLDKFGPLEDVSSYRAALGIPSDKFVALYAGNIGAKQGLSVVFKAATLLTDHPSILFVVVGDGPERDKFQKDYSHLPNVKFLPVQPVSRLCELLNLAGVHLLPQDGAVADFLFPSKLAGMLASLRPTIVMAAPETELYDLLTDAAILLPPGDAKAMADAVQRVAEGLEPQKPRFEEVVSVFSAQVNLAAFEGLLIHVQKNPAKGG